MADINLLQEVFQGITNIVEAAILSIHFDRTYPAIVTEVVDLATGKYRVRYEDSDVVAYARDVNIRYRVNDLVYVQEPAVHSETTDSYLQIVSKVSNTNLTTGELQELTNWSAAISPNLINVGSAFGDGLIAGVSDPKEKSGLSIANFDKYLAATRYMRIDAEFMTHLQSEHYKGNYGLRLYFTTSDGAEATYNFDLKEFNGTPYAFNLWAPQSAIFEVPAGITNLLRIEFFLTDFNIDKVFNKETTSWIDNTTNYNLFVQNIGLYFVDKKDLTQEPYFIYINTPDGRTLNRNIMELKLQAKLYNYGDGVDVEQYVWYKRDLSITPFSEWYDSNLGPGWKEIENSDTDELTITSTEVDGRNLLYRVKAIYNSSTFVSDSVEIIDEEVAPEFTIAQRLNIDKKYELYIDNLSNNEVLLGNWYATYVDNSYNVLDTSKNGIVPFQNGIYYVEVLRANGNHLGYATYTYTYEPIEGDLSDIIVTWTGRDAYLYNANGMVADYTMVERGRTISATINWTIPTPSILSVTLTGPSSGNSLIRNFTSSLLSDDKTTISATYNIALNYDVTAMDNTITLTVVTTEKEYIVTKGIIFARNGDPGTNGTNYLTCVRPKINIGSIVEPKWDIDEEYKYLDQNDPAHSSILLGVFVFKSGIRLNDEDFTVTWYGDNINVNTVGEVTLNNPHNYNKGAFVTAVITVKNNGVGRIITDYYPIDVCEGTGPVTDYNSVLKFIKYNAAGYNPEYSDVPLPKGINASAITGGNINVLSGDNTYLLPAINYISDGKAKAGCVELGGNIIHSIVLYLNTYGNESINGWDGLKVAYGDNYIYAPLIAAGRKYTGDNSFSGVVIGTGAIGSNEQLTGLYGFKDGVATYGFREDGTAFIGAANEGRIEFNGDNGTIMGGGGGGNAKGMTIRVANTEVDSTTKAIEIGKNFSVDYAGNVKAKGDITANTFSTNNNTFKVEQDGSIVFGDNANITWGSGTNPVKVLYSASSGSTPSKNYNEYENATGTWHKNYLSTDYYASYSYSNGVAGSWGNPIKVRGTDGSPGTDAYIPNASTLKEKMLNLFSIGLTKADQTTISSPLITGITLLGYEMIINNISSDPVGYFYTSNSTDPNTLGASALRIVGNGPMEVSSNSNHVYISSLSYIKLLVSNQILELNTDGLYFNGHRVLTED